LPTRVVPLRLSLGPTLLLWNRPAARTSVRGPLRGAAARGVWSPLAPRFAVTNSALNLPVGGRPYGDRSAGPLRGAFSSPLARAGVQPRRRGFASRLVALLVPLRRILLGTPGHPGVPTSGPWKSAPPAGMPPRREAVCAGGAR